MKETDFDRKSTKNIAYDNLREWIINGTLKPGEKIIDTEISSYFSISRTPVREALQMLAEQNLVKIIPSKGTHVTELNLEDIRFIYDALSVIHSSVLVSVFPKITAKIIQKLKNINNKMSEKQGENNYIEMKKLDNEFHNVFLDLSNNSYLHDFCEQLNLHATRAENINFSVFTSASKSTVEHEKIINAIEANDIFLAYQCMTENWMRFVSNDLENIKIGEN